MYELSYRAGRGDGNGARTLIDPMSEIGTIGKLTGLCIALLEYFYNFLTST